MQKKGISDKYYFSILEASSSSSIHLPLEELEALLCRVRNKSSQALGLHMYRTKDDSGVGHPYLHWGHASHQEKSPHL